MGASPAYRALAGMFCIVFADLYEIAALGNI